MDPNAPQRVNLSPDAKVYTAVSGAPGDRARRRLPADGGLAEPDDRAATATAARELMVEHRMEGFWPGTLVGVYDLAQESSRAQRDPPAGAPLATACADRLGVVIVAVPEGVLLAYGSRIDGRPGWIRTRARRSEPPSETSEPTRSEPQPDVGPVKPPPTPGRPSFHTGARGADLGRRR